MLHIVLGCSVDDNPLSVEDSRNEKEIGTSNSEYVSPIVVNIENPIISAYLNTQYDENDYSYTHITDFVTIEQTQRQDFCEGIFLEWENKVGSQSTKIVYATNPNYEESVTIVVDGNRTSYKLCNLIPNRQYWLKIINNETEIVKQMSFSTVGRRRLINLSVGFNCRDIGGLITEDNRIVKYGLLFRGGELDGKGQILDEYDHFVLENVLKIKDVFDLRASASAIQTPIVGATYHSIPTYSMVGVYDRKNAGLDIDKLNNYRTVLESLLSCLAEDKPVYVHCQGGCDRSNTICFLILGVLGVTENDLSLDYELSSFAQGARFAYNDTGGMIRSREPCTNIYHNNYKNAIEYIKSLNGLSLKDKFENFWVNQLGVSINQIEELRHYMLSDINEESQTTGIKNITLDLAGK